MINKISKDPEWFNNINIEAGKKGLFDFSNGMDKKAEYFADDYGNIPTETEKEKEFNAHDYYIGDGDTASNILGDIGYDNFISLFKANRLDWHDMEEVLYAYPEDFVEEALNFFPENRYEIIQEFHQYLGIEEPNIHIANERNSLLNDVTNINDFYQKMVRYKQGGGIEIYDGARFLKNLDPKLEEYGDSINELRENTKSKIIPIMNKSLSEGSLDSNEYNELKNALDRIVVH